MNTRSVIGLSLSALLLQASCKKDSIEAVDLGYAYFPTDTGRWIEYQVDSVWYDEENNVHGGVSYRLRERILEDFTDPEGRPAQRLLRTVLDSTGEWVVRDVWWQTRDNFAAEKTEENLRRQKLSFPVSPERYWNQNVYNVMEEMEVTYEDIGVAWSANSLSFDSTTTVVSTYPSNLIDTLIFRERYAKHVGLVDKFWVRSNSQYNSILGAWQTDGWRMTMTVVDYGP